MKPSWLPGLMSWLKIYIANVLHFCFINLYRPGRIVVTGLMSQFSIPLRSISTMDALRCALRAIVSDSERYVGLAMSHYMCSATSLQYISFTIVHSRSLSLATCSTAQRSRSGNRPLRYGITPDYSCIGLQHDV